MSLLFLCHFLFFPPCSHSLCVSPATCYVGPCGEFKMPGVTVGMGGEGGVIVCRVKGKIVRLCCSAFICLPVFLIFARSQIRGLTSGNLSATHPLSPGPAFYTTLLQMLITGYRPELMQGTWPPRQGQEPSTVYQVLPFFSSSPLPSLTPTHLSRLLPLQGISLASSGWCNTRSFP